MDINEPAMPFTPFHFGPHASVAFPLNRWIDIPVFLAANIAVDMEPFIVMNWSLDYPLHGYCHTLLFGGLIGVLLGAASFPFCRVISRTMAAYLLIVGSLKNRNI